MKNAVDIFRPALMFTILWTVLFGAAYPGVCTLLLQALFPYQSQGSLIVGKDNTVLGSELVGQEFSKQQYFWGRLSATSFYPYNAASSSGSNLGAANPDLLKAVQARIDALKKADPSNTRRIPVDLVTASASGLDPDISMAAADYQVSRVAKARKMPEDKVRELVQQYTEDRALGVLGEPVVNVLKLNLALDGKI